MKYLALQHSLNNRQINDKKERKEMKKIIKRLIHAYVEGCKEMYKPFIEHNLTIPMNL